MKLGARGRRPEQRTEHRAWILAIAGVGLLLWLGACSSQPAQEAQQAPPATAGPERHDLRGTIISVDPEGRSLVVDHEEIPGFMGAMAMPYPVRDEGELENLEPGNQVNAQVVVDDTGMWLENITVVPDAGQ